MENSNQEENQLNIFSDILLSMGITKFDPLLPAALNEYAARIASEILCDAHDYACHAEKTEITVEDVNLSLKLNDNLLFGIDSREKTINELKEEINKKDLVNFVDEDSVLIRYPPDMFLQRIHKYVPGYEAYPMQTESKRVEDNQQPMEESNDNNNNFDNNNSNDKKAVTLHIPEALVVKKLENAPGFENNES